MQSLLISWGTCLIIKILWCVWRRCVCVCVCVSKSLYSLSSVNILCSDIVTVLSAQLWSVCMTLESKHTQHNIRLKICGTVSF